MPPRLGSGPRWAGRFPSPDLGFLPLSTMFLPSPCPQETSCCLVAGTQGLSSWHIQHVLLFTVFIPIPVFTRLPPRTPGRVPG
jgi:hypothetical protein